MHVGRGPGDAVRARLFALQCAAFVGVGLRQQPAQRMQPVLNQGLGGALGALAAGEQGVGVVHEFSVSSR